MNRHALFIPLGITDDEGHESFCSVSHHHLCSHNFVIIWIKWVVHLCCWHIGYCLNPRFYTVLHNWEMLHDHQGWKPWIWAIDCVFRLYDSLTCGILFKLQAPQYFWSWYGVTVCFCPQLIVVCKNCNQWNETPNVWQATSLIYHDHRNGFWPTENAYFCSIPYVYFCPYEYKLVQYMYTWATHRHTGQTY